MNTPEATHQFEELFLDDDERVFRITFIEGDVFRLRSFVVVDPSIYGVLDQWDALIVEAVAGARPNFYKLFRAGTAIDFVESDIAEIMDDTTGVILYRRVL